VNNSGENVIGIDRKGGEKERGRQDGKEENEEAESVGKAGRAPDS